MYTACAARSVAANGRRTESAVCADGTRALLRLSAHVPAGRAPPRAGRARTPAGAAVLSPPDRVRPLRLNLLLAFRGEAKLHERSNA
eukprot:6457603-Prymnesium_polylepis.1